MSDEKTPLKLSISDRAIAAWLSASELLPPQEAELLQADRRLLALLSDEAATGTTAGERDAVAPLARG